MTNREQKEQISYYPYDAAFDEVKVEIERILTKSPPVIRKHLSHMAKSQGKFLRSHALLVSAMNGEDLIHENAVRVCVAIEILHLATLVHDDIIDDAATRRGIETLQHKYGRKSAVICGDYLLCVALRMFSDLKERDRYEMMSLPDYVGRLCLGELSQHENNRNADLSIHNYLRIIRGKTATLFEGAFRSGGVFSEEGPQAEREYAKLGRYIGMIFQLTDDCIDYASTEDAAKKPVQSDYEQGVITLPLIHAMQGLPAMKQAVAAGRLANDEVVNRVREQDGVGFTKAFSKRYYNKATHIIEALSINEGKRRQLIKILDKAYYGIG